MERKDQAELNQESVNFAGAYVDDHFKTKTATSHERILLVNTLAHGYAMGVRRCEDVHNSRLHRLLGLEKSDQWIQKDSVKAAKYYLSKKKLTVLPAQDLSFLKTALSHGFKHGYAVRLKAE